MEKDNIIGHRVVSEVWATRGDDGVWKVEHKIVAQRSEDLVAWESRNVESSARSKSLDTAISSAAFTIATYLESVGGDIFNVPEPEKGSVM